MAYEKPKARPYFYEENGKLKKFYYCSLCGKGPFKKQDINSPQGELRYVAGDKTPLYYCKSCLSAHNLKLDSFLRVEQLSKKSMNEEYKKSSSEQKTTLFVAKGVDGLLYCSSADESQIAIDSINNGKVKSGIKKSSIPFSIVYYELVNKEDAEVSVNRMRKMSKDKKEALIKSDIKIGGIDADQIV